MTKQEFCNELFKIDSNFSIEEWESLISDSTYRTIEYVYNFYPSISVTNRKREIAMLYYYGGSVVIYDMMPRARKIHNLENKKTSLKSQLSELEKNIECLSYEECEMVF